MARERYSRKAQGTRLHGMEAKGSGPERIPRVVVPWVGEGPAALGEHRAHSAEGPPVVCFSTPHLRLTAQQTPRLKPPKF